MKKIISLILLMSLSSCAAKLLKQSPARAKSERFYRLSETKGTIYHQSCKDIKKKNRECSKSLTDLMKEWDYFRGEFVLIPFKFVFP